MAHIWTILFGPTKLHMHFPCQLMHASVGHNASWTFLDQLSGLRSIPGPHPCKCNESTYRAYQSSSGRVHSTTYINCWDNKPARTHTVHWEVGTLRRTACCSYMVDASNCCMQLQLINFWTGQGLILQPHGGLHPQLTLPSSNIPRLVPATGGCQALPHHHLSWN